MNNKLHNKYKTTNNAGFTLIELLLVISIIAILFGVLLFGDIVQIFKSRDAVRKSDLYRIKIALENYYSDHDCYPSATEIQDILSQCDSTSAFSPYLPKIPCDPSDHTTPYQVITDGFECAQKFRIYTKLDNTKDQSIYESNCANGCGPAMTYNYNIPSNNLANQPTTTNPTPSDGDPNPPPPPQPLFYCAAYHICANLDPNLSCGTTPTYQSHQCDGICEDSENFCSPVLP